MTPILVWHTHFESYLLFVWMTRLKIGAATRAFLNIFSTTRTIGSVSFGSLGLSRYAGAPGDANMRLASPRYQSTGHGKANIILNSNGIPFRTKFQSYCTSRSSIARRAKVAHAPLCFISPRQRYLQRIPRCQTSNFGDTICDLGTPRQN
jgi:hypothetical protein